MKKIKKRESIIVHGPQGCGKTFHAAEIAELLGFNKIFDGGESSSALPKYGYLILMEDRDARLIPNGRAIPFRAVMSCVYPTRVVTGGD